MLARRSFEALFVVSWLAACGAPPTTTTTPPAQCSPAQPPPAESPAEPTASPEPDAPVAVATPEAPIETQGIQVVSGECNLAAVPAALIEETTPAQHEAIIAVVRQWVSGEGAPWVIPREGILFAKSEDDLGADPPHPTWTQEQGERACGQQTLWLRDRLLAQLRLHGDPEYGSPIQCSGNVCCYSALGEYDSGGGIVLSQQGESWRLRAGYEVAANGTIGAEYADGLRERVKRRLQRLLRGRCPGEPVGMP